jgi:hypothetical protein
MTAEIVARKSPSTRVTTWHWLLIATGILMLQAAILYAMGRLPICACGYVKLWHGVVLSSENSQHIVDWYTLSHILHGFCSTAPRSSRSPPRLAGRLILAMLVEGGWELVEEFNWIIDRYRAGTISLDYFGDTIVVRSRYVCHDRRLPAGEKAGCYHCGACAPVRARMALHIRDNLALNIIMLITPSRRSRLGKADHRSS